MSESTLLQLYPEQKNLTLTNGELADDFLDESLVPQAGNQPLVYANLLTSLDGRIALADQSVRSGMSTPNSIRSDLDWNMFCHLQAHADVLVTHGGYLRSLASAELGNILNLAGKQSRLSAFRNRVGLGTAPRVVVLTASLDFDFSLLHQAQGSVTVLVTQTAQRSGIQKLESEGFNVVKTADQTSVSAQATMAYLKTISAKNAYLQTGPAMLHSMLSFDLLQRLYLTVDFSFVGGEVFKTLCDGTALTPPANMQLQSLYLATLADKHQQMYLSFSRQSQRIDSKNRAGN